MGYIYMTREDYTLAELHWLRSEIKKIYGEAKGIKMSGVAHRRYYDLISGIFERHPYERGEYFYCGMPVVRANLSFWD